MEDFDRAVHVLGLVPFLLLMSGRADAGALVGTSELQSPSAERQRDCSISHLTGPCVHRASLAHEMHITTSTNLLLAFWAPNPAWRSQREGFVTMEWNWPYVRLLLYQNCLYFSAPNWAWKTHAAAVYSLETATAIKHLTAKPFQSFSESFLMLIMKKWCGDSI